MISKFYMVFAAKHGSTQHAILDIVNAILCNTLVKNMVNYLTLARQFALTAVKLHMSGTLLLEHFLPLRSIYISFFSTVRHIYH